MLKTFRIKPLKFSTATAASLNHRAAGYPFAHLRISVEFGLLAIDLQRLEPERLVKEN